MIWGHPRAEELSRIVDGMMSGAALARRQKHLAACKPCQEKLSSFARVRASLQSLPAIEMNPLIQLQPPVFIPVTASPFSFWAVAGGLAAGLSLLGLVVFRPVTQPMRVVSSPSPVLASGDQPSASLQAGDPLKNLASGDVDLEIAGHALVRLKPGTTITWQEVRRPWIFGGQPQIILNIMSGQILARTEDSFWGSRLQVRTPTANATVKGTAFSVTVEPVQDATTLKVLAGEVFFSPYLGRIGVSVQSGQASRIQADKRLPHRPEVLSAKERKALLETYQIGVDPRVALVIGGGPERADELLSPALLYLSNQPHPELHFFIRKLVRRINQAILDDELASAKSQVRLLEMTLKDVHDPEMAVPLRLFLAGCTAGLHEPLRAQLHLQRVLETKPQHPLAGVALGAIARLAEGPLNDPALAKATYEKILDRHPRSPEAVLAERFLSKRR
ncbi:MAG: FecR domain-containing protein [Candidatus Omnitrophica bacterium]|nr:FecR domain-containing protein [Candidatus Omnitrophota bacterium]